MANKDKPNLIGILKTNNPDSAKNWIRACQDLNINFKVVDLFSSSWLDAILSDKFDFFVIFPPGIFEHNKNMCDERLYVIKNTLDYNIFPSYKESLIYENKKMLSYFLQASNIYHPKTYVFYKYNEAKEFIARHEYPFVAKTSIGATGSGVKIIEDSSSAKAYIKSAFKGKGIRRRTGPNRVTGSPIKWFKKAIDSPKYLMNRLKLYFKLYKHVQKHYVIFQEYIPHDFEWKCIKIGKSYFAHKKIKIGNKASGSKIKEFGMPDLKLMDYVKKLCEQNNFNSVDVDLFEHNGKYLVNEIQCVFGIPYGYLMQVDGQKGRLIKKDNRWHFEEGDFTINECCNLRLITALKQYGYKHQYNDHF